MDSIKKKFIFVFLVFLVVLIPVSLLVKANRYWLNPNDFSIYQQAIYEISELKSFNPYLTIRNLHIFNDHFDPIIYLASAWIKLTSPNIFSLLIFEWFWFLALLVIVYKTKKYQSVLDSEFLLVSSLIIFSRSLLQGFEFPIHPTTWSIVPLYLLFYFLLKKQTWGIVLCALALCLFRESYPFMLLPLSLYFFWQKNIRAGLGLFLLGFCGAYFLFILRPLLLGPTVDYGDSALKDFFSSYTLSFWPALMSFKWPIKEFLPLLLPVILIIKWECSSWKKILSHPLIAALLFTSPLILIHILKNYMKHHHSIPIVMSFMSVIILSSFPEKVLKDKKLLFLVIVLFVGTSSGRYTRMVKEFTLYQKVSQEKHQFMELVLKEVESLPIESSILASGGIIPHIIKPGRQIYQIDMNTEPIEFFEYIIFERQEPGDLNPVSPEILHKIAEKCKPYSEKILWDNPFYIMMKGRFTEDCVELKKIYPERSRYLPPINQVKINEVVQ